MSNDYLRLAVALIAAFFTLNAASAQPKSVGASFSYSGIGLSYEHMISDDCFAQFCIKGEMGELLAGRTDVPGYSASFTWNLVLASMESRNGNRIDLFAGPGITVGEGHDYKKQKGFFFGLACRFGLECSFSRNVLVSASLTPIIGSHMEMLAESIRMTYYADGLLNGIMPEIGIRYRF